MATWGGCIFIVYRKNISNFIALNSNFTLKSYRQSTFFWTPGTTCRGWFNTSPCCIALPLTQHVFGTAVNVHTTRNYAQNMKIYNFKTVFSLQKCEANSGSACQTGTYDCEASSHQVKSEFASQNYLVISVSKVRLCHSLQWLLLAAND